MQSRDSKGLFDLEVLYGNETFNINEEPCQINRFECVFFLGGGGVEVRGLLAHHSQNNSKEELSCQM